MLQIFQVVFCLQNAPQADIALQGLQLEHVEITPHDAVRFDLSLLMAEDEETLAAVWTYNSQLFTPETIQHLQKALEHVLQQVTTEPEQPLSKLELTSAEEKAALERRQRELKNAHRQRFMRRGRKTSRPEERA